MFFLCKLGLHRWQGCKCVSCGQTRAAGHDWSRDCGVCARCGYKLPFNAHHWKGNSCKCCGMAVSSVLGPKQNQLGPKQEGVQDKVSPKNSSVGTQDVLSGSPHLDGAGAAQSPFLVGELVSLTKYLGRIDVKIDNQTYSVHFYPGQTGRVERVTDATTVVLSMEAQQWEEEYAQCEYRTIWLPAFSTRFGIGTDMLKRVRQGTRWSGTSSYRAYHGVTRIKVEFIKGGDAVMYEDLGNNGSYSPFGNRLEWKQSGSSIWIGMYSKGKDTEPIYEFKGTIEGDLITGTQVLCGGDGKWDWVLGRG